MDYRQVGMTHTRKSLNQHHQNQQTLKPRSQTESQLESQKLRNLRWNELNWKLGLPRICRIPHRQSGDLAGQVSHPKDLVNRDFRFFWGFFLHRPLGSCLTYKLKREDCNVLAYLIWFCIHACVIDYESRVWGL